MESPGPAPVPSKVDPRCVVNANQARRFLAAVGELGPRGARMVAFFGCMYYAPSARKRPPICGVRT